MNVTKSLDEYEQLLAPVRECFAVSPGVQAIKSSANEVFLESFLLHFCALGSQMTEPVEGWIRRAAKPLGRCDVKSMGEADSIGRSSNEEASRQSNLRRSQSRTDPK